MPKRFKVLEIIKNSFQLVFKEPSIIGVFLLPVLIAISIIGIFLLLLSATSDYFWELSSILMSKDIPNFLMFSPLFLLSTGLLVVASIWIAIIGVGGLILKVKTRRMDYIEAYKKSFKNSGRLFLAYLVEEILIALGYLFFIIPGIYLTVKLSLTLPGCILEKRGIGIKRSWSATKGNFWKVFLLIFIWMAIFVLTSIIPFLMIVWILLLPVYLSCLTLVYMKLRR